MDVAKLTSNSLLILIKVAHIDHNIPESIPNISAIELDVLQKVGLDCNYPFGMKTSFSDTGVTIKLFWATQTLSQRFQETIQCTQDTLSAALAPVIAKIKDDIQ